MARVIENLPRSPFHEIKHTLTDNTNKFSIKHVTIDELPSIKPAGSVFFPNPYVNNILDEIKVNDFNPSTGDYGLYNKQLYDIQGNIVKLTNDRGEEYVIPINKQTIIRNVFRDSNGNFINKQNQSTARFAIKISLVQYDILNDVWNKAVKNNEITLDSGTIYIPNDIRYINRYNFLSEYCLLWDNEIKQWKVPIKDQNDKSSFLFLGDGSKKESFDKFIQILSCNDDANPHSVKKISSFVSGTKGEFNLATHDLLYANNSAMYIAEGLNIIHKKHDISSTFTFNQAYLYHLEKRINNLIDNNKIKIWDENINKYRKPTKEELLSSIKNNYKSKNGPDRLIDFATNRNSEMLSKFMKIMDDNTIIPGLGSIDRFPYPDIHPINGKPIPILDSEGNLIKTVIPHSNTMVTRGDGMVRNPQFIYGPQGTRYSRHLYFDLKNQDSPLLYLKRMHISGPHQGSISYQKVNLYTSNGKLNPEIFIRQSDVIEFWKIKEQSFTPIKQMTESDFEEFLNWSGKYMFPKNVYDNSGVNRLFYLPKFINDLNKQRNEIFNVPYEYWQKAWNIFNKGTRTKIEILEVLEFGIYQDQIDMLGNSIEILLDDNNLTLGNVYRDIRHEFLDKLMNGDFIDKLRAAEIIANSIKSKRISYTNDQIKLSKEPFKSKGHLYNNYESSSRSVGLKGVFSLEESYNISLRPIIDLENMDNSVLGKELTAAKNTGQYSSYDEIIDDWILKSLEQIEKSKNLSLKQKYIQFINNIEKLWNSAILKEGNTGKTNLIEHKSQNGNKIDINLGKLNRGNYGIHGWMNSMLNHLEQIFSNQLRPENGNPSVLTKIIHRQLYEDHQINY